MMTLPDCTFPDKKLWLYATLLICLISQYGFGQTRAQVDYYYDYIKPLLRLHQSGQSLTATLDSLPTIPRFSRGTISHQFDRDIDFGLRHQRTYIQTYLVSFQLDVVSLNGQLVALSAAVTSRDENPIPRQNQLLQSYDTAAIRTFLAHRNTFYQSHKTLSDFFTELQASELYALTCGDAFAKTTQGLQIERLARQNQVPALAEMLGSIHCETQAYAVAGFNLLKNQHKITPQQRLLISHIKQRNSVVVTCAGCLSGLLRTIY